MKDDTHHSRLEGKPAHPADIYTHCGCAACEARWQRQLAAYLAADAAAAKEAK